MYSILQVHIVQSEEIARPSSCDGDSDSTENEGFWKSEVHQEHKGFKYHGVKLPNEAPKGDNSVPLLVNAKNSF